MKRVNKLAASVAVALSLGVVSQANALIELESDGRGDALLFPVFYGYGENYVTISNSSDDFIQGHLRFRGAAWSGELLDLDVILTPGDVFVFRLADIDGDGYWEIDASLDPNNFAYTGMLSSCSNESDSSITKEQCIDQSTILIPKPQGNITSDLIEHHRHVGYIEFIGEGVLGNMTHKKLFSLINEDKANEIIGEGPGEAADKGQREAGNKLGTHLWSWVEADKAYPNSDRNKEGLFEHEDLDIEDRWAEDVPNALSGTAFLTQTGQSSGLAYNAEALINFRTTPEVGGHTHRVDNYTKDDGVILHNEDATLAIATNYHYSYKYREGDRFESRISYNNTWGPTLADGDDYKSTDVNSGDFAKLATHRWTDGVQDSWDIEFDPSPSITNSIAEVEEAIRKGVGTYPTPNSARQMFTGFYFDDATFDKACEGNGREDNTACSNSTLKSWYFAYFPTKFFIGESRDYWGASANDFDGYLVSAIEHLLNYAKPFHLQVWDIFENNPIADGPTCTKSPCPDVPSITTEYPIREELAIFSIDNLKDVFGKEGKHQAWEAGRIVLQADVPGANMCLGQEIHSESVPCRVTFPGLLYTFDWGNDGSLNHWRPLQR